MSDLLQEPYTRGPMHNLSKVTRCLKNLIRLITSHTGDCLLRMYLLPSRASVSCPGVIIFRSNNVTMHRPPPPPRKEKRKKATHILEHGFFGESQSCRPHFPFIFQHSFQKTVLILFPSNCHRGAQQKATGTTKQRATAPP